MTSTRMIIAAAVNMGIIIVSDYYVLCACARRAAPRRATSSSRVGSVLHGRGSPGSLGPDLSGRRRRTISGNDEFHP